MTLKGFLAGFNKSERESFTTTNRTINQKQQQQQTAKETMLRGYTFYRWLGITTSTATTSYEYSKKQQSNSCVDVVAAVVVVLITDVFVVVQYTHSCSCIWPTYVWYTRNYIYIQTSMGTTWTLLSSEKGY